MVTEKSYNLGRMRMAVGAFYFAMGLTFAGWASRIPDIQQALSLSDGRLGIALFAIPAGQLVMMAVSGYLVAKLGSRLTTIFALLMYALVLFSLSLADSFPMLFAGLFFFGAMANMLNIAVNTQAVFLEKLYGRSILSAFHGLWSLGGLLGGVIGTIFAGTALGIGWHYITILGLCVLTVLCNRRFLVREEPVSSEESKTKSFTLASIEGIIVVLGIMGFGGMFCEGTVFDWSSVYFANVVKPDALFIRAGYIAAMTAMTTGRFLADWFVSRYGAPRLLRFCGLLIVIGLLTAVAWPKLIPATIGFLLVGMGISSIVPICYSLAGQHTSMKVSTAITLVSSVSFVGFLIGPPVIGLISEVSNLRVSLAVASIFGVLIAILSSVINKRIIYHRI